MKGIRTSSIRTRLLLAFVGVLIPYLVLAGVGAVGLQMLWQQAGTIRDEAVGEIKGAADIQVALIQLVMPANDYLITGDPRERGRFEQLLARVQGVLARLEEIPFHDAEERQLLEMLRNQVPRMEAISREILALPDPRTNRAPPAKMKALDALGDQAAVAVSRLREIAIREMEEELERGTGVIRRVATIGLVTLILTLTGGVAMVFILSAWLSTPILAIAEGSRRIAEGDLSQRVEATAGGELGVVVQAFNQMAERLKAAAIENARLHSVTMRRGEQLEALLQATRSVMSGLDLQEILDRIVAEAAEMAGTPHVTVMLVDKAAQRLRLAAMAGAPVPAGFQVPLGVDLSGVVAETGQPLFSADSPNDPRNLLAERDREQGFATYLGLPIKIRDEVLGVLTFDTTAPRHYTPDEVAYLTSFADQAAIAIENARLYEAIRQHAATLEVRVRERTAELEEALRVKAQFLANMSHEFRTPLNFILGFTQLLQQGTAGPLTSKQAHYLGHIHAGGKRLFDLVTDMLDLSQGKTGKKDLHLEPVLLGPMVEELLGMVRVQAVQKRLTVSTALHPGLPFVVADRAKLTQILANLIGNAVKFTPEGGRITLRVYQKAESTKQKAEGGEQQAADASVLPSAGCLLPSVVIEVEDTGIGIKPEDLERIFQGFEQVDSSDTRKYGGAGLGLALVRQLVELHGGRVWAESAGPGQGARFVVRLPHLEALRRKRVMLVADEAPILESLGTVLGGAGYAVEPARSGAQALAALDANPPDLLVLDIGLPGGDGWEILRQVRESEATRALPVLVLTGPDQIHADRALALGANEFLAKPVSARILVETVNGLLVWRELAGGEEGEPSAISPDE